MLLLPAGYVPATYDDLLGYVDDVIGSGRLLRTDVADEVADLVTSGAVPVRIKPVWAFVSFAAVGHPRSHASATSTACRGHKRRQRALDWNLTALRRALPFAPRRLRTISPARWAETLAR